MKKYKSNYLFLENTDNDEPIPKSIEDEELKKIITETAKHDYEEFKDTFSKFQISRNKKRLEKYAKNFRESINRIKKRGYRSSSTYDNLQIKLAVEDLMYGIIDSKRVEINAQVVDMGKIPNAWITHSRMGAGSRVCTRKAKGKKACVDVSVTSELIRALDPDEVIAILLHESGHFYYVHKHVYSYNKFGIFLNLILIASFSYVMYKTFVDKEKFEEKVKLASIISLAVFIVYMLFEHKNFTGSRRMEQLSDAYASYMGYGEELASAFKKMHTAYTGQEFKPIKMTRIKMIIANIILYVMNDPHEVDHVRICKALRITMMDPEIKRNKEVYNRIKVQYDISKCNVTVKTLKDLNL